MRCLIVGMGVQGRKRRAVAEADVTATVDPIAPDADHKSLEDAPLDGYDAALVCTPDGAKLDALRYLLSHGKHVLVEKPLLAGDPGQLQELADLSRASGAVCYTAYNHRFEPHIRRLKQLLDEETLGEIYLARFFYGNGTARDVQRSPWRDQGAGVLTDLGSHLLDLTLFFFGSQSGPFTSYGAYRFENRALDHCAFGAPGKPALEYEVSLISWRNTFSIDIIGAKGSAHVQGLCKWGPSTLTIRRRVLPSGRPEEDVKTVAGPDPTWEREYAHFQQLCRGRVAEAHGRPSVGLVGLEDSTHPTPRLANDIWINCVLNNLASCSSEAKVA